MPAEKMHADEVDIDVDVVRRLLAAQFPRWADLPIEPFASAGTDNAIYRLGDDMSVRLPRIRWAIGQVDKEHQWLPKLAPHLPLAIPVPLARGTPAEGYPWHWLVSPWLHGEDATIEHIRDLREAALDLAAFLSPLRYHIAEWNSRSASAQRTMAFASPSARTVAMARRCSCSRTSLGKKRSGNMPGAARCSKNSAPGGA